MGFDRYGCIVGKTLLALLTEVGITEASHAYDNPNGTDREYSEAP